MPKYKYGWKPQPKDYRDLHIFASGKPLSMILPDEVDLNPGFEPAYDQLQTSSCTGNGVAAILQYGLKAAGLPAPMPSRLWLYGNGRKQEKTYDQDSGANIRDVISGANLYGIIPETLWPFEASEVTTPLPDILYQQAAKLKIHYYATMNVIVDTIRLCLFHKYPIVFGMPIYDYFESNLMEQNPVLHLPTSNEALLGGHCMVITGYRHSFRRFEIRNSWGPNWANKGNCEVDYDYIVSLASNLWMNRFIKN